MKAELITELDKIPAGFPLVCVNGNKHPYHPDFDKDDPESPSWKDPLPKKRIAGEINRGRCKAVGVILGDEYLSVDHDGASCDPLIEKLSGQSVEEALPPTVAFTSGKPGRYQKLYRIPEQFRPFIEGKVFLTGVKDSQGKDEQLDLRHANKMSVVFGEHPETGKYRYLSGMSFSEIEIAECPLWIIRECFTFRSLLPKNPREWTDRDKALACLPYIKNKDLDWKTWRNKLLAMHHAGVEEEFSRLWSSTSSRHTDQGFNDVWKHIKDDCDDPLTVASLIDEAKENGFTKAPEYTPSQNVKPIDIKAVEAALQTISRSCGIGQYPDNKVVASEGKKLSLPKWQLNRIYGAWERSKSQPNSPSLAEILEKSPLNADEFWGWFNKLCKQEPDLSEETAQELSDLVALEQLDRPTILPEKLHYALKNIADRLNLPVEAYICSLLTVAASQIQASTRLEIDPATNFLIPAILWFGLVGESGSKKSPLLRALSSPLDQLQQYAEIEYQAKLEEYESRMEAWEAQPKGERGEKPKKPVPEEFYLSDFTLEALASVLGLQSERGLLILIDELARFFAQMDAYRNGKGGDRQHWLQFWDGGFFKSNRKSTGRVYCDKTAISILGGIQPEIIQKIWSEDTSLDDGLWARFAWVKIQLTVSPGIGEGATYNLSDLLRGLYRQLGSYQALTYRLTPGAKRAWNEWHHEIEQLIIKEPASILRATYPKARERAGRIALVCHLIDAAIDQKQPDEYISETELRRAIEFTRWLMGQTRLLYAEFGVADNPQTAKILKYVNRFKGCGWVTTRQTIHWHSSGNKPSAKDARAFMAQVVSLGYAIGNGKSEAEFQIQIITDSGNSGNNPPQPQPEQGFNPVTTPGNNPVTVVTNSLENKLSVSPSTEPSEVLLPVLPEVTESGNSTKSLHSKPLSPVVTKLPEIHNEQKNWIPQPGDRVVVVNPADSYYGKTARVKEYPSDSQRVAIEGDNFFCLYDLSELTPVDDPDDRSGDGDNPVQPEPNHPDSGNTVTIPCETAQSKDLTVLPEVVTSGNTGNNPRNAVSISGGRVEVDLTRLDLSYQPSVPIPAWQPTSSPQDYQAVSKLYLDIETTGLNPDSDRVVMVGVMTEQGGEEYFTDPDEATLLSQLKDYLATHKPRLLIGHNLFAFDLSFLMTRWQCYGIAHPFTRDSKPKTITASSFHGKPIEFTPVRWSGVDIIDTLHQVAIWDKSAAKLTSYNLKSSVLTLGLRSEKRLELSAAQILDCWQKGDTLTIMEYLGYDLEDTRLLADFLLPIVWYQQRIVTGLNFQDLAIASPALKAQKIHEKLRLPRAKADQPHKYDGAIIDCVNPGLHQQVAKIDVSSLYPSIMLRYGICSGKDPQHKFLGVLQYMTQERLRQKQLAKTGDKLADHQQNALKILINGSYGYFGTAGYFYNDYQAAALVTAYGRKILALMQQVVEDSGATVIELDTDGILFSHSDPQSVTERVQSALPEGIKVDLELADCGAFVPKAKSYVIVYPNGKTTVKGLFRKRDRYPLENGFPVEFIKRYFQDSPEAAIAYYQTTRNSIINREIAIEQLTVTRKIGAGEKKLVELGLGKPGDIVSYYYTHQQEYRKGKPLKSVAVEAISGDYWVEYYLRKLDEQYQEITGDNPQTLPSDQLTLMNLGGEAA